MQSEDRSRDVKERDNIYVVEIELQEYKKEDIAARFHAGFLTVTAQKMWQEEQAGFKKAFYVGKGVSKDHIRAAFHNGILKFMIPKDEESYSEEPTEIEIM